MRRITKFSLLLSLVLGLYFPAVFAQSNMTNEMFDLAKLKSGVKNKRISSTDPTGGNRDHLEPFNVVFQIGLQCFFFGFIHI